MSWQPEIVSWNLAKSCNLGYAHCYLDAGAPGKQGFTRQRVEEMAKRQEEHVITLELMEAKYSQWAKGSAEVPGELVWSPKAMKRLERVPDFISGMVVKSIEAYARMKGATEVSPEIVDEAKAYWESTGTFHL